MRTRGITRGRDPVASAPRRLSLAPGLVVDGPFAETKECVLRYAGGAARDATVARDAAAPLDRNALR